MSADPFNFGSPNAFPSPPPGSQPPGGRSNPFGGSVPDNPLSAPNAGHPSSAQSATPGPAGQQGHPGQAGPSGQQGSPFGGPAVMPGPFAPSASQGQSPRQTMFPGAAAPGGELVAAKPPTWLLFAAAGLALLAGVVAIVLANPVIAIVCWLLAGPVAIGLLALFVIKDTFARSSGLYAAPGWVKPMHYAAICVCLLCILAPALRLADWVGHL